MTELFSTPPASPLFTAYQKTMAEFEDASGGLLSDLRRTAPGKRDGTLISEILHHPIVDLAGYALAARDAELRETSQRALSKADASQSPWIRTLSRFVRRWLPAEVWIERACAQGQGADQAVPLLSSTSFPPAAGLGFFTAASFAFIPPHHLLTDTETYDAHFENMVHEATHHLVAALLAQNLALLPIDWEGVEVVLPWRAQTWPLDRALHASCVYRVLHLLRSEAEKTGALSPGIVESAKSSASHFEDALAQVGEGLDVTLQEPFRTFLALWHGNSLKALLSAAVS
jgi:hypothetical protein